MDSLVLISTNFILFIMAIFVTGVKSLDCYSCVYIHNVDSQKSCSDPWTWYRDKFNVFSGPPKRECAHSCMKIVINHPGEYPTVVRTCGKPCNETKSGYTTTSCCESELCNNASHVYNNFSLRMTLACIGVWLLITRQYIGGGEEIS